MCHDCQIKLIPNLVNQFEFFFFTIKLLPLIILFCLMRFRKFLTTSMTGWSLMVWVFSTHLPWSRMDLLTWEDSFVFPVSNTSWRYRTGPRSGSISGKVLPTFTAGTPAQVSKSCQDCRQCCRDWTWSLLAVLIVVSMTPRILPELYQGNK